MARKRFDSLRAELDRLGRQEVRLPDWDPYILGEHPDLRHQLVPAREAARIELERWRCGRFPSVALSVADAVFSKQKEYTVAVRTSTRPFAQFFGRMSLRDFCSFDPGNMFRLTFGKEPRPEKERSHLAPEGRLRTIREVCRVLRVAEVETVEATRKALAFVSGTPELDTQLVSVFGFGDRMLANLRMNVGILTVKADVHIARFLAPYLGLSEDADTGFFHRELQEGRDVLGMEPFEVDQLVWYTSAASGRV